MRPSALLGILLLTTLLFGCQSYEAGLRVMCEAPHTCAECGQADPSNRMVVLSEHIDGQLSNGEARELYEALAVVAPEEKSAILRREAASVGITSCPLADVFLPDAAETGPDQP